MELISSRDMENNKQLTKHSYEDWFRFNFRILGRQDVLRMRKKYSIPYVIPWGTVMLILIVRRHRSNLVKTYSHAKDYGRTSTSPQHWMRYKAKGRGTVPPHHTKAVPVWKSEQALNHRVHRRRLWRDAVDKPDQKGCAAAAPSPRST